MSKMDNLRAMREERYERDRARAKTATPGASAPKKTTQKPAKSPKPESPDDSGAAKATVPTDDELCGHRSMNGRACTREKGHSAKSHRYS